MAASSLIDEVGDEGGAAAKKQRKRSDKEGGAQGGSAVKRAGPKKKRKGSDNGGVAETSAEVDQRDDASVDEARKSAQAGILDSFSSTESEEDA